MNRRLASYETRKKELIEHSTSILDVCQQADREPTAIEQKLLDRNNDELDKLSTKIAEEHAGMQNTLNPVRDDDWDGFGSLAGDKPAAVSAVKGKVGARYADLFGTHDGYISEGDFFGSLASGTFHPSLNAMNEGSGNAGGYVVPEPTSRLWLDASYENSLVWPRATVFPMTSESLRVPGFDASSAASGTLYGGMTFSWLAEEGTGTASNPTFRQIRFRARKLAIFSQASNELAEDGLNLAAQLEGAMIKGAAWALDFSFLNGTGAGEPLGILNSDCLITVDAEAGQEADTIVYENLIKMHARCANYENAVWIANHNTLPQLASIVFPGTLGGWPIWNSNAAEKVPQSIFGRPLYFTEKLPTLGDKGDILLVDLSQYGIGMRRELTIERSQHVAFMQDVSTWRGIVRVDGQPLWNSAYTPYSGDTLSPFVTLAERA